MTMLREQAVLSLNDGINTLQNESADWKSILKDLDSKLDKRIQDILTYNIPYILDLASAKALSITLCVKESIKDEVIYYLQVARAELITGVRPPLPHTRICLASPSPLKLDAPRNLRNTVYYTGYYIHSKDSIKAYLFNTITNAKVLIPRSNMGFPDISNITVSLNDYTDATLSNFTHILLFYNNDNISTITIEKKTPDPIVIKTVSTRATNIVYIPPLKYGDTEFNSNGPKMIAHVYLRLSPSKVEVQVYLSATETKPDWTNAAGFSNWIEIYSVESGFKIIGLKSPTPIYYYNILRDTKGNDYIDTSISDFTIETVVGRAILVGDTNGGEAGSKTKITLNLKSFPVEIQKL